MVASSVKKQHDYGKGDPKPGALLSFNSANNDEAAKHRIRESRRRQTQLRLKEEGLIPNLMCSSLLNTLDYSETYVLELINSTYYRDVIEASGMFYNMPTEKSRRKLMSLDKPSYQRLSEAIKGFGNCISIAAYRDLNDLELARSLNKLKIWVVSHGLYNPDQVCNYLKWLSKSAMQVAMGTKVSEGESYFPGYNAKTHTVLQTPFTGHLSFIDEYMKSKSEEKQFSLEEYRALSQIGSATRSLPYPSKAQAKKSVEETLELIFDELPLELTDSDKRNYQGGLRRIEALCGAHRPVKTHSSLSNSGTFESSQSEGGKGAYLVSRIRPFTDMKVDKQMIDRLSGLIDCFDEEVLPEAVAELTRKYLDSYNQYDITLGDILYLQPHDCIDTFNRLNAKGREVPPNLGKIVGLFSSYMMLEIGRFSGISVVYDDYGIIVFHKESKGKIEFKPMAGEGLDVRCALSIESGMKTRLTTSQRAAVAQISQLMRHPITEWLSKDPLLKIGFEEPDKLWEVLKTYHKFHKGNRVNSVILNTDLKEATYRLHFIILEMNQHFLERIFRFDPVMRVYHKLFRVHSRRLDLSDLLQKGYIGELEFDLYSRRNTTRGAFMGDGLSFIHLSLFLSSVYWQASYEAQFNCAVRTPLFYYEGFIHRPLGQIVGDDCICIDASPQWAEVFRRRLKIFGAEVSKIDSVSKYFGTFCEQCFAIPNDKDELTGYAKESIFSDIFFLDIIKGSLLCGRAKVKSDGADPFIGHAKMLNKILAWHPRKRIIPLAQKLFWSMNYYSSRGLGDSKPFFPTALGGLDIPLGDIKDLDDPNIMNYYGSYLETISRLPLDEFLKYSTLLSGISRASPKGLPWSNDELTIALIVSQIQTIEEKTVVIPEYVTNKGHAEVRRYLNHELELFSVRQLADRLVRLENFYKFWTSKVSNAPFVTLKTKGMRARFKAVWSIIRREVQPSVVSYSSLKNIAAEFDKRTWGLLFNENDPAFKAIFEGMSNLVIRWNNSNEFSFE